MTVVRSIKPSRWQGAALGIPTLAALLVASIIWSAGQGAVPISGQDVRAAILGDATDSLNHTILWHIRLPRIVMAGLVGAALACGGATLQGVFRNPLADPALLGVSAGAACAVALVLVLGGAGGAAIIGMPLAAFTGSLACCLLVLWFARNSPGGTMAHLLLAGIAINALAGAATSFMIYHSTDQQIRAITFWMMGSLGGATWPMAGFAALCISGAGIWMVTQAQTLNILLLGDTDAAALGVDPQRTRLYMMLLVAVATGAAVANSGIIGFLGLAAPHLMRLIMGPDHRILLPASALCGALLLIVADTLARTIVAPAEMPVGILTSLLGGPFFLWLLARHRPTGA